MYNWILVVLIFTIGFVIGDVFGIVDTRREAVIHNSAHYYVDKLGNKGFDWDNNNK